MKRQLILGSSSKPRQQLLQRLQIPFTVVSPDIDETPLANEKPTDLVLRLAESKARKVAENFSDHLIIGADQVGILDETILCKPLSHEDAVQQLQKVSEKRIQSICRRIMSL